MRELLCIGKLWELAQLAAAHPRRRPLRPGDRRRARHRPRRRRCCGRRAPSPRSRGSGRSPSQAQTIAADDRRPRLHRGRRRHHRRGDAGQRDARSCATRSQRDRPLELERVILNGLLPGPLQAADAPSSMRAQTLPGQRDPAVTRSRSSEHRRADAEREQAAALQDAFGNRLLTLPFLFAPQLESCRAASARTGARRDERRSELLEGRRVCVCAGAGGVGKTTTSAAIALGMAARGLKVAVVTIDPARRLANALGLERARQRAAPGRPRAARRASSSNGELWAMMLDPKRTFDELIERLAPTPERAEEIKRNRVYRELSTAVSGSQEFTAIEKLYELAAADYDLLVLDTPPARNALEFLDAPGRLTAFLGGGALQTLLRPTGFGMRLLGIGAAPVLGALKLVTGVDLVVGPDDLLHAARRHDRGVQRARRARRAAAARPGHRVPARHLGADADRSTRRSGSARRCEPAGCRSPERSSTACIRPVSRREVALDLPPDLTCRDSPPAAERLHRAGRTRRGQHRAPADGVRRRAAAAGSRARQRRARCSRACSRYNGSCSMSEPAAAPRRRRARDDPRARHAAAGGEAAACRTRSGRSSPSRSSPRSICRRSPTRRWTATRPRLATPRDGSR